MIEERYPLMTSQFPDIEKQNNLQKPIKETGTGKQSCIEMLFSIKITL
jgi:hypothetical protein